MWTRLTLQKSHHHRVVSDQRRRRHCCLLPNLPWSTAASRQRQNLGTEKEELRDGGPTRSSSLSGCVHGASRTSVSGRELAFAPTHWTVGHGGWGLPRPARVARRSSTGCVPPQRRAAPARTVDSGASGARVGGPLPRPGARTLRAHREAPSRRLLPALQPGWLEGPYRLACRVAPCEPQNSAMHRRRLASRDGFGNREPARRPQGLCAPAGQARSAGVQGMGSETKRASGREAPTRARCPRCGRTVGADAAVWSGVGMDRKGPDRKG
jgi:hypothetical protein